MGLSYWREGGLGCNLAFYVRPDDHFWINPRDSPDVRNRIGHFSQDICESLMIERRRICVQVPDIFLTQPDNGIQCVLMRLLAVVSFTMYSVVARPTFWGVRVARFFISHPEIRTLAGQTAGNTGGVYLSLSKWHIGLAVDLAGNYHCGGAGDTPRYISIAGWGMLCNCVSPSRQPPHNK